MVNRATKLRWRRRFRRQQHRVENLGEQAEQQLEAQVISRLGRLWRVRRFLVSWVVLITFLIAILVVQTRALSPYYQTQTPQPGGIYTEGILGSFTTANPLYAVGAVDSSVAKLVFSGLCNYDDQNRLVGDLAESWQVNERGNVYQVVLKPNLKWQDGQPLNSADVVFTYQTIQNPDADSPLFSSWQGIKVEAVDERTVSFTLPSSLSAFPYSLTNGILPRHILSGIPATQLRSISFDTVNPVGAGPFAWEKIEVVGNNDSREERIGLVPNKYYNRGAPKLDNFIIRAFHNEEALINSYNRQELTGVVGFNRVPNDMTKADPPRQYSFPLTSQTMVFFKTTEAPLSSPQVRQALGQATNSQAIAASLGYPVQVVDQPLLRGQPGNDKTLAQKPFNPTAANQLLDAAGWVKGNDGWRYKDGKQLSFKVLSESTPEYALVTSKLQSQWKEIGVNAQFVLQSAGDLQTALAFHTYDALLYGISIGPDPDVLAYWHSSQADIRSANRLNFSEYKSPQADAALEAGRTRTDPVIRALKYRPFLEAWRNDVPAVGLYQPRFLYLTSQTVYGLTEHTINTPVDRFSNVQNWMIRQEPQNNP